MRAPRLSLSQILITSIFHLSPVASTPDIRTSTGTVTNPLFAPTPTSTPNSNSNVQGYSSNYSPSGPGIILGAAIGLGVLCVLGLLIGGFFCRKRVYKFPQRARENGAGYYVQRPAMDADAYAEIERKNAALMVGTAVLAVPLREIPPREGSVWVRGREGMEGKQEKCGD